MAASTPGEPPKGDIDRKALQKIRRRFDSLHQARLQRIQRELPPHQQNYIKLLSLLFHINHPMLPGYVNSETPAGLSDFSPSNEQLRIAKSISRSFAYRRRAHRRHLIHGIYLMGSMGSIAHTDKSDFDIWLIHDPQLDAEQRNALSAKATLLEVWGDELGLEVHFFVMDVDSFRRGNRAALSHESSGTTQQRLLLEEFYRTGIRIAGRYPLWWLVPPEHESDYRSYADRLLEKRFVNPHECLDFGGLQKVPVAEFFSAAHWQLFKGIESPYKAVLKILLMEAYAREYPDIRWLCQQAKAAIYGGCTDLDKLDPYVRLYLRVEQYLLERGEPNRLELARHCFYFKTEQALSQKQSQSQQRENWKAALLLSLSSGWGWGQAEFASLDARDSWKIDRVTEERNRLVQELSYSYRLLTTFAREHAQEHRVDPADLNLLGRKLYAALERRPGKIEYLNPGISKDMLEEQLTLHRVARKDEEGSWFLYRGEIDESERGYHKPLKTSTGLVELLTWCHLNRITSRGTHFRLYPESGPITAADVSALLGALRSLCPHDRQPQVPLAALASVPYVVSCVLFVNVGHDPMAHLAKQGKQLTSSRCNPLSFGAMHVSLLHSLEQLISTSWGELLVVRHDGKVGLLDSICRYLQLAMQAPQGVPAPVVNARGFSSNRASRIAQRIEEVYQNIYHNFSQSEGGLDSRYIIQIDDGYYLIQRGEKEFSWFEMDSMPALLEELGQPLSRYRPTVVDPQTLMGSPIPTILRQNRAGQIQLFFYTARGHTDLYILDEQGALFCQQIEDADEHHLLVQQQRFFEQHLDRRDLLSAAEVTGHRRESAQYYRLSKSADGEWWLTDRHPPVGEIPFNYLELRLLSDSADLTKGHFSLVCRNREFSAVEYGDQLYAAVAEQVQAWRRGNKNYPLYLTGVELAGVTTNRSNSTIEMLHLKKRLEEKLNQALGGGSRTGTTVRKS